MAKKTQKRKVIGLTCENCGQRHHYTVKNTQNTPDKITLRKYCPTIQSYCTYRDIKAWSHVVKLKIVKRKPKVTRDDKVSGKFHGYIKS